MNTESPLCVPITVKKTKTPPETGKPKTNVESSRSYREAMKKFAEKHKDFSRREGNISAVLPQGSPGPLKEEPEPDEE